MSTKPTFFQTGPEKVVPVKNVYDGAKPKYPEKDEGFKSSTAPSKPSVDLSKIVKSIKPDQAGNLKIDKDAALKALKSTTRDLGNPIGGLSEKQQKDALHDMGVDREVPGSSISNSFSKLKEKNKLVTDYVQGTIDFGNTKKLIRGGDINSVNSVVNVINALTNGSVIKVEAFNSRMAIIRSVMDDLQRYGIIESIDYLLKTMADSRQKKKMLARLVPMFFISADINNLNLAIKILGAGRVLSLYPAGISAFCSGFKYHWSTKPEQYKDLRNRILKLFNTLDPNWNITIRNSVVINNLDPISYMSSNFYTIFSNFSYTTLSEDIFPGSGQTKEQQTIRFTTMVLCAKRYPSTHLERALSKQYPKASFTFRRSNFR